MSNVISIYNKNATLKNKDQESNNKKLSNFDKIQEFNDANAERIKKERQEANKTVLKSYRIKT